jgi:hypothetical protein
MNKAMKKLLAIALFALPLFAQPKLDVNVKQVNDRRTKGSFSQLTITVELPKLKNAEVAASRVLVSSAVDDSGETLVDAEASAPELESNMRGSYGGAAEPMAVAVTLKNPARKATTVKQVSGEIELFMPGKDPNSVAEIAKFTSQSGRTLSHKALKANGVEITPVSEAQLAVERKRLGEVHRKELADAGYDEESLKSGMADYMESVLKFDDAAVPLRVKDPNKRIQEMVYVDGKGEVKRAMMRDEGNGYTVLSTWGEKPQADWKLRVSMKTPKNIVRYPFVLTDVALP